MHDGHDPHTLPRGAFTLAQIPTLSPAGAILHRMKVEEIAEAIAKLPPDQLARFRRWFTAFEAGRADHAKEFELHCDQTRPPRRPRVCRIEKARE